MTQGGRDAAAYEWLKDHAGILYTILVGAAVVSGIILGVAGGVTSNGELASNGWAIATFAAFVGAMVRLGYNIGLRAGPDRTEEQLAQLLESVNHVERVVTGGQPRGVVSQLRRRPEPPSSP